MKNEVTIVTKIIKDGKTGFGESILAALAKLEGKRAVITIAEYHKLRTVKQNRYYWGVVLKYYLQHFKSQGNYMSGDDMHLWIKEHVWNDWVDITIERVNKETGEVFQTPFRKILTSTLLTTVEWEERMALSRQYAAENFNMQIPEPSEKIDEHVLYWLEHPEGIYYQADYKNYFNIKKTHPEVEENH